MSKYKLPIKDSLVVGHINPDGDSLSSVKAVINYLRRHGKVAVTKTAGQIPEHLAWILPEEDIPREIPEVEQTIVLDCGPTQDRVGFEISGPIINIDHHVTRSEEHRPRSKVYVLDRCSTAAALVLDFGIIDDVLLVGLYTDTLFMRSWNEVLKVAKRLAVSDEKAAQLLSSIRPTRYIQALTGIKHAKIHRCRNGFLIVEIEEKDQIVVSEIMDTLFKYSDNVCLIDGETKARLRTSNKELIDSGKVAEIANVFGGGGHAFASGCDISGKRTAFLGVIKQLDVHPTKIELNGYEEGKEE
jgi:phosphoesterase RecJ-like protein